MESIDPRPQLRSGRRRQGADSPVRGLFRNRRAQVLTAAAAALTLLSATAVYASIQAGPSADAVAPPGSSVSGSPTIPGTADAGSNGGATTEATSPTSASPASPTTVPPTAPPAAAAPDGGAAPFSPAFDAPINAIIDANSRYAVGVALIDVKDGVVHEYGDKTKFVAASTAKILAAAAYYHLVETGQASLATRMGSSTAAVQIRQMVQQSNNDSWALILRAVGHQGLTAYAASLGISYDRTVNHLSPAETAKTLSLLYSGQLLNPENSRQLLSYMQQTNYETLIPAAVPAGIEVFHKYGLLSGNLHDASILVQGDRAFVFVVYTLGQSGADMPARTRVIHQLTQTVAEGLF
ncbi:beta-lactamase class A [Arthrobacter sp. V4I6]|uniref:serine hydrolase n=1 Tax=unclassified Arthrobacter TaxID=235627 RepID=UPI00278714D7|nr:MULTISPECIES: serine hydrolase [unclassified Arthrobacter]MDQ0820840.1 beta-lactamase class A [Arthrobacter sp. V1I7]MDQ0855102.1 beta-lactamase class A [Arthrobacter sp. V4I6]